MSRAIINESTYREQNFCADLLSVACLHDATDTNQPHALFAWISLLAAINQSQTDIRGDPSPSPSHDMVVPAIAAIAIASQSDHGTADWTQERMAVIGSSLGDFYAT